MPNHLQGNLFPRVCGVSIKRRYCRVWPQLIHFEYDERAFIGALDLRVRQTLLEWDKPLVKTRSGISRFTLGLSDVFRRFHLPRPRCDQICVVLRPRLLV